MDSSQLQWWKVPLFFMGFLSSTDLCCNSRNLIDWLLIICTSCMVEICPVSSHCIIWLTHRASAASLQLMLSMGMGYLLEARLTNNIRLIYWYYRRPIENIDSKSKSAIKHNIKQENRANVLYFPAFPGISTFGSISWGGIFREILLGKYRHSISQTTLHTILCK